MDDFSKILKDLRLMKGLSQEGLGKVIHVSRSAIAKYENGLGLPSEEVIEALCRYFEVDREHLFPKKDLVEIIVKKNRKIRLQNILLFSLVSLFVLAGAAIGIGDTLSRLSVVGGNMVVNASMISEAPSERINYFTIEDNEFGYVNTYKNQNNHFILQPGGEIWSVNGIPDVLMGFYNNNDISLYVYTTPNNKIKVDSNSIADNGKHCFVTFGYGKGYNFVIINDADIDVNIRQLEFWC